jgi:hypothetical protein
MKHVKAEASSADQRPIAEKLRDAPGIRSLDIEQEVARALRRKKWDVRTGVYYKDPLEDKYREFDVLASLSWKQRKRSGKRGPDGAAGAGLPTAMLNVLAECKSLTDWHIVFGEPCLPGVNRLSTWPGHELESAKWGIVEQIRGYQRTAGEPLDIARKLAEAMFPKERSRTWRVTIDPPHLSTYSSSFRETKPGADRELDSSVLWKAFRELRAAFESYRLASLELARDHILGAADAARFYDEDPVASAVSAAEDITNDASFFHPVVVLDARLWRYRGGRMTEIPYARLIQMEGRRGGAEWWADVVHRRNLDAYVDELTTDYLRIIRRTRSSFVSNLPKVQNGGS